METVHHGVQRGRRVDHQPIRVRLGHQQHPIAGENADPLPYVRRERQMAARRHAGAAARARGGEEETGADVDGQAGSWRPAQRFDHRLVGEPATIINRPDQAPSSGSTVEPAGSPEPKRETADP